MLLARGQPGLAGRTHQVQNDRILRPAARLVRSPPHRRVQAHLAPVAARALDRMDSGSGEGPPIAKQDVRVDERHLRGGREGLALVGGQLGAEMRDHRVPAGEHRMPRAHRLQPAAAHVGQLQLTGDGWSGEMADTDDRGFEPQADRGGRLVESLVVGASGHHVLRSASGDGARNQPPHEQAGQRGIAVGEVEEVGLVVGGDGVEVHPRAGRARQAHPLEAGEAEAPGILGRDGVDPQAEEALGLRLQDRQHVAVAARDGREEVGVAQAGEPRLLVVRRKPGQVVDALGQEPQQVAAGRLGERRRAQERTPLRLQRRACRTRALNPEGSPGPRPPHQAIRAEALAIEEDPARHPVRRVESAVEGARIA